MDPVRVEDPPQHKAVVAKPHDLYLNSSIDGRLMGTSRSVRLGFWSLGATATICRRRC